LVVVFPTPQTPRRRKDGCQLISGAKRGRSLAWPLY
jgi:hypothetical protein